MKVILLAGGSGKRLWPLSNDIRSKIFLKLLQTEDGRMESMLQRVCRQLENANLLQSTYIVTSKSQVELIQSQVGDQIPIITEPDKKGTFHAISLSATYLSSKEKVKLKEPICVMPVDPYVEEDFYEHLHQFPTVLKQSQAKIALLGKNPTFPSEEFGYIVPKQKNKRDYLHVDYFKEKPSRQQANELIEKGSLWNCGVFAFILKDMIEYLRKQNLPINFDEMIAQYEQYKERSFDEEVVEKSNHVIVIPHEGVWSDLGSWGSFSNYISNVIGEGEIIGSSENTHLVNEIAYPIKIIDIPNIIVAASSDGILVANKGTSSKIKKLNPNQNKRPMFEEKRWGKYKVINTSEEDMQSLTKRLSILPGKNISYQTHEKRHEVWTIISGVGEFILDDQLYSIKLGDVLQIPQGASHAVKAITALEIIEVQLGTELIEEDIIRFANKWEDILESCQLQPSDIKSWKNFK